MWNDIAKAWFEEGKVDPRITVIKFEPTEGFYWDTKSGKLVRNNLQRKTAGVHSTKMGLKNIAEKYRLMNRPGITVEEGGGEFRVTVPLIGQVTSQLV